MSLFKARDWWTVHCGVNENFDGGSLATLKLHLKEKENEVLEFAIVGSLNGCLRIFSPQAFVNEDGELLGFMPTDLLLEANLKEPILQVCTGQFTANQKGNLISILHPKKLAVYSFTGSPGKVLLGAQYQLHLLYQSKLPLQAFNLIHGYFGANESKELICVQFEDSSLAFYDQEHLAFYTVFSNGTLPGPISYIANGDIFLRTFCQTLECYSFHKLGMLSSLEIKMDGQNEKSRKLKPDWTFISGDTIRDIATSHAKRIELAIYILGERTIYGLGKSGELIFTKDLDCDPLTITFYTYKIPISKDQNKDDEKDGLQSFEGIDETLQPNDNTSDAQQNDTVAKVNQKFRVRTLFYVTTQKRHILVYENSLLVWMAQLPFIPVSTQRINLKGLNGVIMALSEKGILSCFYLGTDPTFYLGPVVFPRPMDCNRMIKETQSFKKKIRSLMSHGLPLGKDNFEELNLFIKFKGLNFVNPDSSTDSEDSLPAVTYEVFLHAKVPLRNVRMRLSCCPSVKLSKATFDFFSLHGYTKVELQIRMQWLQHFSSLKLKADVHYEDRLGVLRYKQKETMLPLVLLCRDCEPSKGPLKIFVELNQQGLPLGKVYKEFTKEQALIDCIGLETIIYGHKATISLNQSSDCIKIESDYLPLLWVLLEDLQYRLKRYSSRGLAWKLKGSLPVSEYFELMDEHSQCLRENLALDAALGQQALQFRVIQKRLLYRIKEKVPSNLYMLDEFLDIAYRQVRATSKCYQTLRRYLQEYAVDLNAATNLMVALMASTCGLDYIEKQLLAAMLFPLAEIEADQSWEQWCEASLLYVTFSVLLTQKSTSLTPEQASHSAITGDVWQLQKLLELLLDLLSSGNNSLSLLVPKTSLSTLENQTLENSKSARKPKRKQTAAPKLEPIIEMGTSETTHHG